MTLSSFLSSPLPHELLLSGPSQSGKTHLCFALASALSAPLHLCTAGALACDFPGRFDLGLTSAFLCAAAAAAASASSCCVLLLDGLDALLGAEESRREDEEWDALRAFSLGCTRARQSRAAGGASVCVVATCQWPSALHPMALAHFAVRLRLGPPQPEQRGSMLLAALAGVGVDSALLSSEAAGGAIAALAAAAAHGFLAGDFAAVARDALLGLAAAGPPATSEALLALLRSLIAARTPLLMVQGGGADAGAEAEAEAGSSPALATGGTAAGQRLAQALQAAGLGLPQGVVEVQDHRAPCILACVSGGELVLGRGMAAAAEAAAAGGRERPSRPQASPITGLLSGLAAALRPTIPSLPWEAIKGQAAAKASLQQLLRLASSSSSSSSSSSPGSSTRLLPSGILLYGPPGTGKTLLAKAAATALGARFVNISIPSVLRAGLGDSEAALASAFHLAQLAAPSLVFMDEVQALFASRAAAASSGSSDGDSARLAANLTATLLHCMDGVRGKGVTVLAATNMPSALDQGLLRPGRLDRAVYVGLPSAEERGELLASLLAGMAEVVAEESQQQQQASAAPLQPAQLLAHLVQATAGFSGADCVALCSRAVAVAVRRSGALEEFLGLVYGGEGAAAVPAPAPAPVLTPSCFLAALHGDPEGGLAAMTPSVSAEAEAVVRGWRAGK